VWPAGLSDYPLFCQKEWFFPGNASLLRGHIRHILLQLFSEQVECHFRIIISHDIDRVEGSYQRKWANLHSDIAWVPF
jgi:hypothetical protein